MVRASPRCCAVSKCPLAALIRNPPTFHPEKGKFAGIAISARRSRRAIRLTKSQNPNPIANPQNVKNARTSHMRKSQSQKKRPKSRRLHPGPGIVHAPESPIGFVNHYSDSIGGRRRGFEGEPLGDLRPMRLRILASAMKALRARRHRILTSPRTSAIE